MKLRAPINTTADGLAFTITTRYGALCENNVAGGGNYPMTAVIEYDMKTDETMLDMREISAQPLYITCAMRGRPKGNGNVQQIEMGGEIANAITTVQKDSMLCIYKLPHGYYPGGFFSKYSPTITTSAFEHNNFVCINPRKKFGEIVLHEHISPCLLATGYKDPHLMVEMERQVDYRILPNGNIWGIDPINGKDRQDIRITDTENIHPTLISSHKPQIKEHNMENKFRIRKLTPRECYRLMDVSEEDIDKLLATDISKSQHYKLAGNSIVVSCLYYIFKQMFTETEGTEETEEGTQFKLF